MRHVIKIYSERLPNGFISFICICVELDLSEGLPYMIIPKGDGKEYLQPLDYENTAFTYRNFQYPGHLQNACPASNGLSGSQEQIKPNRRW